MPLLSGLLSPQGRAVDIDARLSVRLPCTSVRESAGGVICDVGYLSAHSFNATTVAVASATTRRRRCASRLWFLFGLCAFSSTGPSYAAVLTIPSMPMLLSSMGVHLNHGRLPQSRSLLRPFPQRMLAYLFVCLRIRRTQARRRCRLHTLSFALPHPPSFAVTVQT